MNMGYTIIFNINAIILTLRILGDIHISILYTYLYIYILFICIFLYIYINPYKLNPITSCSTLRWTSIMQSVILHSKVPTYGLMTQSKYGFTMTNYMYICVYINIYGLAIWRLGCRVQFLFTCSALGVINKCWDNFCHIYYIQTDKPTHISIVLYIYKYLSGYLYLFALRIDSCRCNFNVWFDLLWA